MLEFFLPSNDRTVIIQLVVVLVTGTVGLVASRRRPDVRLLVAGVFLLVLGGIGLRALH
jgi:hypothetical protein